MLYRSRKGTGRKTTAGRKQEREWKGTVGRKGGLMAESCPQDSYVAVLTPQYSEYDLHGDRVIWEGTQTARLMSL